MRLFHQVFLLLGQVRFFHVGVLFIKVLLFLSQICILSVGVLLVEVFFLLRQVFEGPWNDIVLSSVFAIAKERCSEVIVVFLTGPGILLVFVLRDHRLNLWLLSSVTTMMMASLTRFMMESWLSALNVVIALLSTLLQTLFVLFPLLSATILLFLLTVELSLFAMMETFFVAMLFFHHGSVSLILSLLSLFILSLILLTLIALLLFVKSLTFFVLTALLFLQSSSQSLSLAMASGVGIKRWVIVFLLIFDNSLSLFQLLIFSPAASLFVLSFLLTSPFAGLFLSPGIGFLLFAKGLVGTTKLLVELPLVLLASLASFLYLAPFNLLTVSEQVIGLFDSLFLFGLSVLLSLEFSAPFVFSAFVFALLGRQSLHLLLLLGSLLLELFGLFFDFLGLHQVILTTF